MPKQSNTAAAVAVKTKPVPRDDPHYTRLAREIDARVQNILAFPPTPIFRTNAVDLYDAYLKALPKADRQHHNCHACREFVNRYGGLVTVDKDGKQRPLLWDKFVGSGIYAKVPRTMHALVSAARIVGVFLPTGKRLGTPVTGEWSHLSCSIPMHAACGSILKSNEQMEAEKLQDFFTVERALDEWKPKTITTAVALLRADALYRSEKVLEQAEWLKQRVDVRVGSGVVPGHVERVNLLWQAVALAPAGFCHPRAGMLGTLLDDIESGAPLDDVKRRFGEKMHPLRYQRPQAAPKSGTIARAETIVAQLAAAGALRRRYARLEELQAIWKPPLTGRKLAKQVAGVFGHLVQEGAIPTGKASAVRGETRMTFAKFRRDVLPHASRVEFLVPSGAHPFCVITTAADMSAPPILQWDNENQRNPFSWYFWHGGRHASQYRLSANTWADVAAVVMRPCQWHATEERKQWGTGAVFILRDARETKNDGNAIFPETPRSEFHEIRSVIEAHSAATRIEGNPEDSTACGIGVHPSGMYGSNGHQFRVTSGGVSIIYTIDRWE